MNVSSDNLWIVALIFIIAVVGINVLMIGAVRSWRGFRGKDLFDIGGSVTKPWKKEDDNLRELHQRVEELKSKQKDKQ